MLYDDHRGHHGPIRHDFEVGQCDDQLPIFANAGVGPAGDSIKVILHEDSQTIKYQDTILNADGVWEEVTKTDDVILTQWIETKSVNGRDGSEVSLEASDNINGGMLWHTYNYRPYTYPATFTITFWYLRNDTHEVTDNGGHSYVAWRWTTRPIPYIPDYETGGDPNSPGSATVGTGIGALYIRADVNDKWMSKLIYPPGVGPVENSTWNEGGPINPNQANSPAPKADWSVNITLGIGGDIDIPNLDNIAKILGWSPDSLRDLVENGANTDYLGQDLYPDYDSVKDYIDTEDDAIKNVIQPPEQWENPGTDMDDGFGPGAGQTIYEKISVAIINLQNQINSIINILPDTPANIANGGMKIAAGNINLYGNAWNSKTAIIMTHDVNTNKPGDQLGRATV